MNVSAYAGEFAEEGNSEAILLIYRYNGKRQIDIIIPELDLRMANLTIQEARERFKPPSYGPVSFWGGSSCRSGSIASGGIRAFCTCDGCF